MSLTRRNIFSLATAATLTGLAAPQILTRAAFADVPLSGVSSPGFHRFMLGDFQITVLLDGLRAGEAPQKTYAINQPEEAVADLLQANLLPADRFVNGFTPTLVNTGSELILFDTGMGAAARENGQGKLPAMIEAAGYKPEQITIVVLTHFHPDHIGGLMENGAPTFANARYVTGQAEYDFWTSPDRAGTPAEGVQKIVLANVKPLADKTSFLKDGDAVVSGITALAAFGHTPGHMAFRVESSGKQIILIADTANHFVITLQRPEWHVVFDADKEIAAATRKRIFDMIASERLPFIGYHMPFPAIGYLQAMDQGYRYVPESYQLDL